MRFDTSPRTLQSLNHLMQQDARVLRWTILKLATNVEDVATKGQQDIIQTGIPEV
jgi:small subunit ribosomal protein S6